MDDLPSVNPPRRSVPAGATHRTLVVELVRHYLTKGRSSLLLGTLRAALASTGLGVMSMVIAMALMSGYTRDLEERLLSSGALLVHPRLFGGFDEEVLGPGDAKPYDLRRLEGVVDVMKVSYSQGTLSTPSQPAVDVVLRGVEPGRGRFSGSPAQLARRDGIPGALLGTDLAERLGLTEGDHLRLVSMDVSQARPRFHYQALRFTGVFASGFAEYDQRYVVVDRSVLVSPDEGTGIYEVSIAELRDTDRIYEEAQKLLGDHYRINDWRSHNPVFTALRVQKIGLFMVLGLIVLVSTFNVASTLVVIVRERMHDIGVLGAIGLRPRQLELVFLTCGGVLGLLGIALGACVGCLVSWFLTTFEVIHFNADVAAIYFIDSVPLRVELGDVAAIVFFSMLVVTVASWLPARRAARIDPAMALRQDG